MIRRTITNELLLQLTVSEAINLVIECLVLQAH